MQIYANYSNSKIISLVLTGDLNKSNHVFYPSYNEKISFLNIIFGKIKNSNKIDERCQLIIKLDLWQELYSLFVSNDQKKEIKSKLQYSIFYKNICTILNKYGYKINDFDFEDIYILESPSFIKKINNRETIITGCCTFDIIKKEQ